MALENGLRGTEMSTYCRITTLEYKDQASAEALGKEYVETLMPKYEKLGAIGLMAVRVGPRSVAYVSRYQSKEQADTVSATVRSEILKKYSQYVVSPPSTAEGEIIGESIGS